ncbi:MULTISPECIES: hypothetical protein [Bacillus]|nr:MULTISPECIES: hypothetical protein [Bacillus]MCQ6301883.1 hypothetical protein [Bacillus cereus]MEB9338820.1 hypothetical protein [Bacillus cereus]MEC5305814.1 hypothetical protein [Bacillus thuringiensis]CCW08219.1 hypothetical protein EBGED10_49490 [Bacillus sp. GeD10]
MKRIVIITMIIVGVLSPIVSQTSNKAMSKNKTSEHAQRAFSDPGTG